MDSNINKNDFDYKKINQCWKDMKNRCSNPKCKVYKYYGMRGISVCDKWSESFLEFYFWSISHGYERNLSIDRVNTNGNYEPDNCRWSNRSIQGANKRPTGDCEYIGVHRHSCKNRFVTSLKFNKELIFIYESRSKNDCAKKRNDFIVSNHLQHPLNEIRKEYEICYPPSRFYYYAKNKKTGSVISFSREKDLAKSVGLTGEFIIQCISGKRNSSQYLFWKEKTS